MRFSIVALICLSTTPAWAENNNLHPFYDNVTSNMVYPQVSGDYLVYSQRVNHNYQVMRLKLSNLNAVAKDVSPTVDKEAIHNGLALKSGDVVYTSNRTGKITPWISYKESEAAIAQGMFQNIMMPNHLDVSDDAQTWVFDSTFEPTRQPRIENQFTDGFLQSQLLGQAWRMYNSQYWIYKSSYPESVSGAENKFSQPTIFTFQRNSNELTMLGDGFDASVSADGKKMVFVREDNGNFDLWLQNTDGSNLTRLTKNKFADLEPSLSADGKRVVFISNRDAQGDILQTSIYTLEIATRKITRITKGTEVADGGPAWLDDKNIIFHSNRNPNAANTDPVDHWSLWAVSLPN